MPVLPDFVTFAFLFWVCVLLPALAFAGWWRLRSGKPLRSKLWRFRVASLALIIEGVLALFAAKSNDITLRIQTSPVFVVAGIGLALLMVFNIKRRWATIDPAHRARQTKLFAADTAAEWRWGVLLAICAGIFEEIAYRGVLFSLLQRIVPSMIAIIIAAVIFALAHVTQGIRGFAGVLIVGLLFHLFLALTGSLGMGIALHTVYDIALFTMMYKFNSKERTASAATS